MIPRLLSATVVLAGLAACTTPDAADGQAEPIRKMPGEDTPCVADTAQQYVGQKATQTVGEMIVKATGARIFQWVPANSAVTMDYRPDRVRVSYGEDMVITSVRCG